MDPKSYISGPTSYYYLKPNHEILPPILLFGDTHPSEEKQFKDGDDRRCPDDKSVVTHKVDESAFIETLKSFLPPASLFPIDIYLEDFLVKNRQTDADGPLSRLRLMSDEKKIEPLVRWHRVDARDYVSKKPAIERDIVKAMMAEEGDTKGSDAVDELKEQFRVLLQKVENISNIDEVAKYVAPRICDILRYPPHDYTSCVRDQIHKALINDPDKFGCL